MAYNELERLTLLAKRIRFIPSHGGGGPEITKEPILALITRVRELEAALESIRDYWNGFENHRAMADACWHNFQIAEKALQKKEE